MGNLFFGHRLREQPSYTPPSRTFLPGSPYLPVPLIVRTFCPSTSDAHSFLFERKTKAAID